MEVCFCSDVATRRCRVCGRFSSCSSCNYGIPKCQIKLTLGCSRYHGPPHFVKISLGWLMVALHTLYMTQFTFCRALISHREIEKFCIFAVTVILSIHKTLMTISPFFRRNIFRVEKISRLFFIFCCSCFYGVSSVQVHKRDENKKKYNKITPRIEEEKLSFERLLLKCVVDSFARCFLIWPQEDLQK